MFYFFHCDEILNQVQNDKTFSKASNHAELDSASILNAMGF